MQEISALLYIQSDHSWSTRAPLLWLIQARLIQARPVACFPSRDGTSNLLLSFSLFVLHQVPIQFWQHEVADMRLRTEVKAGSVLDYACDEPTLPPHLTLTAKGAGSSEVTADMNFFREYNKLYYENFIYIAATHTFSGYGSCRFPCCSPLFQA